MNGQPRNSIAAPSTPPRRQAARIRCEETVITVDPRPGGPPGLELIPGAEHGGVALGPGYPNRKFSPDETVMAPRRVYQHCLDEPSPGICGALRSKGITTAPDHEPIAHVALHVERA